MQDEEKTTLAGRQKPEETKHRLSFEERRRQHRQEWTMNQYPPIRSMRKVVRLFFNFSPDFTLNVYNNNKSSLDGL